ncbi:ABC transporter substrate-binding protein [Tsukamurella sp. NPDC003166]|uniref:ABC transporter substrate-binding protein n=1 Tax=Tsukamurella sp. NPDC003166 TaxID=3154444 RepID=UPI0033A3B8AB
MLRSRLLTLALPVAVTAALVAGCGSGADGAAPSSASAGLVELKFGAPWNGTAGKKPASVGAIGFGLKKGVVQPILARHGFKYGDYVSFNNGPPVAQALSAGSLQIGQIGDTPAVQARGSGLKLSALVVDRPTNDIWFLTKIGGVKSIKELAGKKVALQFGSNFDKYGRAVLERAGVLQQTELVNLLFADALPALQRGDIDAVPVPATTAGIWRQRTPFPILSKASQDNPDLLATSVTLASDSFVAAHPAVRQAVWEAIEAGNKEIAADPDGYARFESEVTGAPEQAIREANLLRFGSQAADPDGVRTVRSTLDFLVATGKVSGAFDVNAWVNGK